MRLADVRERRWQEGEVTRRVVYATRDLALAQRGVTE